MKRASCLRRLAVLALSLGTLLSLAGCGGSSSSLSSSPGSYTQPGPSLATVNLRAPWVQKGPQPLFDATQLPQSSYQSGRVNCLAPHPTDGNVLTIAGANSGVWRSTNGGQTWVPLADNAPTLSTGAVALDPSDPRAVYVASGESVSFAFVGVGRGAYIGYSQGVYRIAADGGYTLLPGSSQFNRNGLSSILVSPAAPNVIYVGVTRDFLNGTGSFPFGVYRSIDGGNSFNNLTMATLGSLPITDMVMDPTDPQTLYAAAVTSLLDADTGRGGVYKSVNGGTTWTQLNLGQASAQIGRIRLSISAAAPQQVLALVAAPDDTFQGLFASANGGTTWSNLALTDIDGAPNGGGLTLGDLLGNQGTFDNAVAADTTVGTTAYVGGIQVVRIDQVNPAAGTATAWQLGPGAGGNPTQTQPHVDIHAVGQDSNGSLLAGTDGGLWRLDHPRAATAATPWVDLNASLPTLLCFSVDYSPATGQMLSGMQDNGCALFTGSQQWTEVGYSADGGFVGINPLNPNQGIISSQSSFIHLDSGVPDFVTALNGLSSGGLFPNVPLTFARDGRVASAGNGSVARFSLMESLDVGVTGHLEAPVPSLPTAVAYSPLDSNLLYVGTIDGKVFVRRADTSQGTSPENPADVVEADNGLPAGKWIGAIAGDPRDRNTAYLTISAFDGSKVFKTTNAGLTWSDLTGNLPNLPTNAIAADGRTNPSTLFVGNDQGVLVSSDGGGTWNPLGTGFPSARVTQLVASSDGLLTASTFGRSVFQMRWTTDFIPIGGVRAVTVPITPPGARTALPPAGGHQQRTYRR